MAASKKHQKSSKDSPVEKGFDFESIVRETARMQMHTQDIPRLVQEEMKKGWRQAPNFDPKRSPKSWFFDPLSLQYALGYKDRRFSLTFDVLKRVVGQLSILNAIINLRSSQVAAFSEPYRKTRSLGYVIKHKDPDHATTPAEVAFIKELEQFIGNCGRSERNPYSRIPRDDFDTFLRKIVRDSLTYDQVSVEVVPDRGDIPFEFVAVDSSTIRIAADDRFAGINSSFQQRSGFIPSVPSRFSGLYEGREYGTLNAEGSPISYVQVVYGQIENVYSERELAFGVRNPRTDIYIQQYGYSEVEQLITIVTSMLYAEMYNQKMFTQNSIPKGILNFKGDNFTPEQLEQFKRAWTAQVKGTENAFNVPVLQSEGLEWVDLQRSNEEMGYNKWLEYLLKVSCGVFLVDPSELNFAMQGGVSQTPLFESSQEWKLKASRDRGLKPILKFIAKLLNKYIIDRIDPHFTLEFVGLDEMSEQEKQEHLIEGLASFRTLNEVRRELDLPEVQFGDIVLNPTYLQAMTIQQQAQQQEQAPSDATDPTSAGGSDNSDGSVPSDNTANYGLPGTNNAPDPGPRYADHYGFDQSE